MNKMMNLYREDQSVIYLAQNHDPFFDYLTAKCILVYLKKKKGKLLDLGCGGGRNSIAAAKRGLSAVGVDLYPKSLRVAKKYAKLAKVDHRTKFIKRNLENLKPGSLGKFDYCILQEVVEHLTNYRRVISFARYSLNKGGILIITTPNNPKQWNLLDDYARHLRRFTIAEIKEELKNFKKVKIYTVGFPFHRSIIFLYNQFLLLRGKKHNASRFRQNPLFNKLYFFIGSIILRIDHLFSGTSFGTTIVAVAEK